MEGSYKGEVQPLPLTHHECIDCHPLGPVRIFKGLHFWLLGIYDEESDTLTAIEVDYCPFCGTKLIED